MIPISSNVSNPVSHVLKRHIARRMSQTFFCPVLHFVSILCLISMDSKLDSTFCSDVHSKEWPRDDSGWISLDPWMIITDDISAHIAIPLIAAIRYLMWINTGLFCDSLMSSVSRNARIVNFDAYHPWIDKYGQFLMILTKCWWVCLIGTVAHSLQHHKWYYHRNVRLSNLPWGLAVSVSVSVSVSSGSVLMFPELTKTPRQAPD
jgi:hypothetical protein